MTDFKTIVILADIKIIMKSILLSLFLLLSSFVYSQQFDYNIYTGMTKKEIIHAFKYEDFKYKFDTKLYVDIDSSGNWHLSDDYYTWYVFYNDTRALFTFDYTENRCVRYYQLFDNLDIYWSFYDYYNRVYTKLDGMNWSYKKSIISLRGTKANQTSIFVEIKK